MPITYRLKAQSSKLKVQRNAPTIPESSTGAMNRSAEHCSALVNASTTVPSDARRSASWEAPKCWNSGLLRGLQPGVFCRRVLIKLDWMELQSARGSVTFPDFVTGVEFKASQRLPGIGSWPADINGGYGY